MKIPDSTILSQNYHMGSELYASSKSSLKAFSAVQQAELTSTSSSSTSKVVDIISLTLQAQSSSKQIQQTGAADQQGAGGNSSATSSAVQQAAGSAGADSESKATAAMVQLIEMLTGMKAKLLTQADLKQEEERIRSEIAKATELLQPKVKQSQATQAVNSVDQAVVQTGGTLKLDNGSDVSFTLDMVLPKDAASTDKIAGGVTSNGTEIVLQKNPSKSSAQNRTARSYVIQLGSDAKGDSSSGTGATLARTTAHRSQRVASNNEAVYAGHVNLSFPRK